uniref:non-specific serine/threonine protein kinase n=1 Tax=Anopheles farauti TaxID=69004 RepID=A0A182QG87_9DIPT
MSLRNSNEFIICNQIGCGAFGEVFLVRQKSTRQVYAMKRLLKENIIAMANTVSFENEINIMTKSKSEWIVKLHYTFEDTIYQYMVMDFMPGGDIDTLMIKHNIPEKWALFYTMELILAVDAVHQLGYIHRDIKPANMLLDRNGHLKLADFGVVACMDDDGLVRSSIAVGTPEYMSPEVLMSQDRNGCYGRECDWWAVGIFVYEIMVGDMPFETQEKTIDFQNSLHFPDSPPINEHAKSLIKGFLTDRMERLGRHSVDDIKLHPIFSNALWKFENIHQSIAPIVPKLSSDDDTSNFVLF